MDLGLGGDGGDEGLSDAVECQEGDVVAIGGEDVAGAFASPTAACDQGEEGGAGNGAHTDDDGGKKDVELEENVQVLGGCKSCLFGWGGNGGFFVAVGGRGVCSVFLFGVYFLWGEKAAEI